MFRLPNIQFGKITVFLAVLTWIGLLLVDLTRVFGTVNEIEVGLDSELTWILEILFFILLYLFFSHSIAKHQNDNFLDLIWRAASTGLIAMGVGLLIVGFYVLMQDTPLYADPLLRNFFYHVNFALTSLFLISTALLWKHLILYQRNKSVVQQWQAFEIILLVSMFFVLINKNEFDYGFFFGMTFLIIYSTILSANLKWIPYLTFKEKWKSILFLLTIQISAAFLFFQIMDYSFKNPNLLDLSQNLFMLGLFAFVIIYSLFSFLVTLFNLPTSSVFEQKLIEAINFQRLSQSIQPGEKEEQVLDILMDSCMSAAYVDAAWLEIIPKDAEGREIIHQRFISNDDRLDVRKTIAGTKPFSDHLSKENNEKIEYIYGKISHELYKSALVFPLRVNKKLLGNIFLVKEVKDGFNKEMINIISTFVGQASISVENYRLLNEAIVTERYKEELEIAQRVQRSLLPTELHHNACFEIEGFSAAADEVGGDYYETYQFDATNFALIIGDVSGKGTSAAFNMSQMKGIFHSLVQFGLSPKPFLIHANDALSRCLEKNHFITTTYYLLDTASKKILFSRAGHCPTLYYNATTRRCEFLKINGLGLGMLRNQQYGNFLEEGTLTYSPSDVLVLYTDGIIEAKNQRMEEFGYEQLKYVVNQYHYLSAKEIKEVIIRKVYEFIGKDALPDDDYSLMVIKFIE
nr:SpoIIE family protein phosphatase [Cytophagales bacterium]